jgi:hypothetical protein
VAAAVKIHVTPELIERATYRDSRHCVVAEALQLARPHFRNILVDLQTIRWTNSRTRRRYICLTPEVVCQALVDFDQGHVIQPFAVNLDPIHATEMKRRTNADGSTSTTHKTSTRRLRLKSNAQLSSRVASRSPPDTYAAGGNVERNAAASKEPPESASNMHERFRPLGHRRAISGRNVSPRLTRRSRRACGRLRARRRAS